MDTFINILITLIGVTVVVGLGTHYYPQIEKMLEEKQRLNAGTFVRFECSIFWYFNPVIRWSINSIDGYFMNLSLNYDLQQNICKAVLGRVVNAEIALDYLKIPDDGATTRVTVKGTP